MIKVRLVLDAQKRLRSFSAEGHAKKGIRGSDIVCSAVTILLRTTLAVLEETFPSSTAYSTGPGSLAFEVPVIGNEDFPVLLFAADFLIKGIESLVDEYPKAVRMQVIEC